MRAIGARLCAAALVLAVCAGPAFSAGQWGLMLNDDGDSLFEPQPRSFSTDCSVQPAAEKQREASLHLQYVRCRYKGYRELGIDTLKLNVFSALAYFDFDRKMAPTLSRLDSRAEHFDRERYASLVARIETARQLLSRGPSFDPVMAALDEFRRAGGRTVLSFRVADSHYLQLVQGTSTETHPLTPQFFLDHPEWTIGREHLSPDADRRLWGLMDFERPEVRRHFLSAIRAGISKYGKVIDGVEIDFTRSPFLFRAGNARRNAPLVEEMLAELRKETRRRGLSVLVRVPTDLSYAAKHGLDVDAWITGKLVDVVVPSELMQTSHDPDIEHLVSLAKRHKVLVYYGIPGRRTTTLWRNNPSTQVGDVYSGTQEVTPRCDVACVRRQILRYKLPSPDYIAGVAVNARAKGADGVELFNFASEPMRMSEWLSRVLIPNLKAQFPGIPVTYSASQKTAYGRSEDSGAPGELPLRVAGGGAGRFRIYVGSERGFSAGAELRVSFLEKNSMDCNLQVASHARPLEKKSAHAALFGNSEAGDGASLQKRALKSPAAYFPEGTQVYSVPAATIKQGYNNFQIRCARDSVVMDAEITSSPPGAAGARP